MRRAEILDLVGLSVGQFDALIARKLAPIGGQRRATGGWGVFAADDAFRLGLFGALAQAGMQQVVAAGLVRADYDDLLETAARSQEGDLWFGAYRTTSYADGAPSASATFAIVSTLPALSGAIAASMRKAGDQDPLEGVTVINATAVMRRILQRAQEHDILNDRLSELARLMGAV